MERVRHRSGGRAGFRRVLAIVLAVAALLWVSGWKAAQAEAPAATFAYVVYPQGWNLIAPGGQTSMSNGFLDAASVGPLFTFQPGDSAYETAQLNRVKPGAGYWAYFSTITRIALDPSLRSSATVEVTGGTCVMVGNPSTNGSARIQGADRTYGFSAVTNSYIEERLIGIGRGAWACNDSHSGTVTVTYAGDLATASWPNCCSPQPISERGLSLLIFHNDSPSPIIVGLRQITESGDVLDPGEYFIHVVPACSACPEYATHSACGSAAVAYSIDVDPGLFTLHIQSDGVSVPDLQVSITVEGNMSYDLCYFVDANRPQKSLP
ncbi:MAG: hypothetical protein ACYDCQ_02295 [Dehalococcoidia bacterium]